MESYQEWLAEYLRLEYGENKDDPDSIKSTDLKYIGEFVVNDVVTKYWSYPTSSGQPMWVTIEMLENGECAGMTDEAPPEN